MLEVARNLALVLVWVAFTAALARGIHALGIDGGIGGGTAVLLWFAGQALILSPVIWICWRDRHVGAQDAGHEL